MRPFPLPKVERVDVDKARLEAIVERTRASLSADDHACLKTAIGTLVFVARSLASMQHTASQLRAIMFGPSSEKTKKLVRDLLKPPDPAAPDPAAPNPVAPDPAAPNRAAPNRAAPDPAAPDPAAPNPAAPASIELAGAEASAALAPGGTVPAPGATPVETSNQPKPTPPENPQKKPKAPGHGRNGADAYQGAEHLHVNHQTLAPGDRCPECKAGNLYETVPRKVVRITGQVPLAAAVVLLQALRCATCGAIFTARSPPSMGSRKYAASAVAMIAALTYYFGLPFNRLQKLQKQMGVPLPATTQWEIVYEGAKNLIPVLNELRRQGAQAKVVYHDDTHAKILALLEEMRRAEAAGKPWDRTGIFTSGIICAFEDGRHIALYFTGLSHAGENLDRVLDQRAEGAPPPIRMADQSSSNSPKRNATLDAGCNTHARRQYVHVVEAFPVEVQVVLEKLLEVYKNDAFTRREKMSDVARLEYHQSHSASFMNELKEWCEKTTPAIEPNSGLGKAIKYMTKYWSKLTLFLRVAGAPLDNNICERALKFAIRRRRASLFFKSETGACVSDLYMSLFHSAQLNRVSPYHYVLTLMRFHKLAATHPERWMPWNYLETLKGASMTSADEPAVALSLAA